MRTLLTVILLLTGSVLLAQQSNFIKDRPFTSRAVVQAPALVVEKAMVAVLPAVGKGLKRAPLQLKGAVEAMIFYEKGNKYN